VRLKNPNNPHFFNVARQLRIGNCMKRRPQSQFAKNSSPGLKTRAQLSARMDLSVFVSLFSLPRSSDHYYSQKLASPCAISLPIKFQQHIHATERHQTNPQLESGNEVSHQFCSQSDLQNAKESINDRSLLLNTNFPKRGKHPAAWGQMMNKEFRCVGLNLKRELTELTLARHHEN